MAQQIVEKIVECLSDALNNAIADVIDIEVINHLIDTLAKYIEK